MCTAKERENTFSHGADGTTNGYFLSERKTFLASVNGSLVTKQFFSRIQYRFFGSMPVSKRPEFVESAGIEVNSSLVGVREKEKEKEKEKKRGTPLKDRYARGEKTDLGETVD